MSQAEIESQAIRTYAENLLFLKSYEPELFNKIESLNLAIEKNYYEEKYSLEHKDGYFDVLEKKTNKFLYGESSIKHAELAAKSVDYKKEGNLFETFHDLTVKEDMLEKFDEMSIEKSSLSAAARIIHYANIHAPKQTTTMIKIYKYIFVGTGLGLHLEAIHNKIKSNVYFIIEDDLELFRLSLFVTNYKNLTLDGAILIFSIFDNEKEFETKTEIFLHQMFIYNHYLKFFHLLSHNETKIKTLHKIMLGQTHIVFNYSALTNSLLRALEHLKNKYNILNISKPLEDAEFLKKPILILGAGPSLNANIKWLKKNKNKFVIVVVSAMLSKLEAENIKPDIITHVHGFNDAMKHLEKIKDKHFFDKSICLFGAFSTPEFVSFFEQKNVYIFQGLSRYKKHFEGIGASNIGALTYGLSLLLGARDIYLLGLDFALDQKTGATHSNAHSYVYNLDTTKTVHGVEDDLHYKNSVVETKGNFQEKVTTNLLFDSFKRQCNLFTEAFIMENRKVYNLSDGAYIEKAIPTHPEDIDFSEFESINKNKLYKNILDVFSKHSENFLTKDELDAIESRINYVTKIEDILNEYSKRKYANMDNFHYHLLGTFIDILGEDYDKDATDSNNILSLYLQFVSGYIFDLINTKELKNEKKHIKALNKIVISQFKKILRYYKGRLEFYLKEIPKSEA